MANRTLTADIIAKEALLVLDNELGVLDSFYRAPEDEFSSQVNGYKKGQTISINRPMDFTVTDGAVMDLQDAIEGKVSFTVNKQKHIAFQFSQSDLTLSVSKMSERVIKPAMINLVNEIAADCMETFYPYVYNWVGTAGNTVDSFADFIKAPERLSEMAVPMADRHAAMSPSDYYGMLPQLAGLNIEKDARSAYRSGKLGDVSDVSIHMSQVVPSHTNGAGVDTSALTDGNSQEVTYDTAKDTWTQTLITDGWGTGQTLTAGTVFTIGSGSTGVYMVNPKTKRNTGILQQFTIVEATTTNANSANDTNLTISPPIITSGPHQTVTYSGNFDGRAIDVVGAVSTSYKQNLVYHKNAFALAMVPLEKPAGAYGAARQSYKGLSVLVTPVFDGINFVSKWRLDVLYGRKCIDPRLATRLSGSS